MNTIEKIVKDYVAGTIDFITASNELHGAGLNSREARDLLANPQASLQRIQRPSLS